MKLICTFVFLLFSVNVYSQGARLNSFAFGSCNRESKAQPMWNVIRSHRPELFIWGGDNIYADTADAYVMEKKYKKQLLVADYIKLKKEIPIIGTWDDHDFGKNNAGKEYSLKEESQELFLNFIGEPTESKRWDQKGIYTSYDYGIGSKATKIILLDTRYHRDLPNKKNGDTLGSEQWSWLEGQLKNNKAKITFIFSSYSVLARKSSKSEEWADFPKAKKKLFMLLTKYKPSGLIFLTGDRHFSAYLGRKYKGKKYHELMASGLTHYTNKRSRQVILKALYGKGNTFFGLNFGLININWEHQDTELEFNVYNKVNRLVLYKLFKLKELEWVKE